MCDNVIFSWKCVDPEWKKDERMDGGRDWGGLGLEDRATWGH